MSTISFLIAVYCSVGTNNVNGGSLPDLSNLGGISASLLPPVDMSNDTRSLSPSSSSSENKSSSFVNRPAASSLAPLVFNSAANNQLLAGGGCTVVSNNTNPVTVSQFSVLRVRCTIAWLKLTYPISVELTVTLCWFSCSLVL